MIEILVIFLSKEYLLEHLIEEIGIFVFHDFVGDFITKDLVAIPLSSWRYF